MLKQLIVLFIFSVSVCAAFNVTTYTYKTVGDIKIELDVYTPPTAAPATGYPVFFAIHGGAYLLGSKQGASSEQEATEAFNRGWVIVSIDYRMWPSVFLQDILEDIQDAYFWVRTELIKKTPINPNIITIFGQSAGGGLAVLSGYKLSPRPVAIIGFYFGCTNWTDPLAYDPHTAVNPLLVAAANKLSIPVVTEYNPTSSSDPRVALWGAAQNTGKMGWLAVTHDPNLPTDQVLAKLRDLSASENVDANYPPTYLAHGLADTTVAYNQSVQMANSLEKNKIDYVLDLVPGAQHNFDYDSAQWEQHVLPAFEFVQKYMPGSREPPRMSFLQKYFPWLASAF